MPSSAREEHGSALAGLKSPVRPADRPVRAELERILASSAFAGAERASRFLRYIVEQALEGNPLKETLVGVEVFGRKPAYDPRLDGVVRVEAVKLRSRLKEYYETAGAGDELRIDLPKGGYLPTFETSPRKLAAQSWWRDWRIIGAPIALLVLAAACLLVASPRLRSSGRSAASASSIAVLPFVNLSSDKENEYFSDGLTDDLIGTLTKMQGLRVVARGSAFQFKGKNPDIRTAGRQLNVATVLEGSVQKSGGRLRITAQLSSVADGYHLWSETYDRELKDVFAVQDEITRAIVRALEVHVARDPGHRPAAASTQDLDAYNLYLQGRFHLNKWRPDGARKGIEYFQQAIAKDPAYAPAYAGLADCHTWLGVFGWSPAATAMPQAREAANRALHLDETLAAAHISLGYVKALYDWDWPGVQREFRRALDLSPGDPDAHFAYSLTYLAPLGRLDEALAEIERARSLDPLSPYKITAGGMIDWYRRDYDRAAVQYRKAIELDPAFYYAYDELRHLECARGATEAAAAVVQSMRGAFGNVSDSSVRAAAYSRQGKQAEARALVESSIQEYVRLRKFGVACHAAELYAVIGEKERSIEWLQKAYQERNPLLAYVKVMPSFECLRSDRRFNALLMRLGLTRLGLGN